MKNPRRSILQACALLGLMASAFAVKVGEPAPGFTAVDSNGKQQRLSDYKVPDRITFLNQPLPRNAAGKVLKGELRKMIEGEATA